MGSVTKLANSSHPGHRAEAFERYYDRLMRTVLAQLPGGMRGSDVLQNAWLSFACREGPPVNNRGHLFRLLVRIVRNKLLHELRFRHAQKRDVNREVDLDRTVADGDALEHNLALDQLVASKEPRPEDVALLHEITASLGGRRAKILRLSLEGWTPKDIAEEMGRAPSTMRSTIRRITSELQKRIESDSS